VNDITFISIPKTGSRSIHRALRTGKKDNHRSISKLRPEGESFAVIRHPLDRLVSWWAGHRRPRHPVYLVPFKGWAAAGFPHHWDAGFCAHCGITNPLHQHQFVEIDGEVAVTHLVPFERMNQWVHDRFGVSLQLLGASEHSPYQTYYDAATRRLAGETFARDMALYQTVVGG
jgi:hypothetical protein